VSCVCVQCYPHFTNIQCSLLFFSSPLWWMTFIESFQKCWRGLWICIFLHIVCGIPLPFCIKWILWHVKSDIGYDENSPKDVL
jgi:hypothetical protein